MQAVAAVVDKMTSKPQELIELDKCNQMLSKAMKEVTQKTQKMYKRYDTIHEENLMLKDKIVTLEEEKNGLLNANSGLKSHIEKLDAKIQTIRTDSSTKDAKIAELTEKLEFMDIFKSEKEFQDKMDQFIKAKLQLAPPVSSTLEAERSEVTLETTAE